MNRHTKLVSDAALRCLAFGHAWEFPEEWPRFNRNPEVAWTVTPDGREHVHVKLSRLCTHGCGTVRVTTMKARLSIRGNLLDVVSTRHNRVYTDRTFGAARRAAVEVGDPTPTRAEYRAELLARQLRTALKSSGVRMRRADASANILMMGR